MKISNTQKHKIRKAFNVEAVKKMRRVFTSEVTRKITTGTCVVSPKRAIIIESLTGVPKSILRPDIFQLTK